MDRPLRWQQSCQVNIAELDQQHERLFGTVADLEDAVRAGRGDTVAGKLIASIIQHTISHFAAEELLMQQHGFPGLAEHRIEHQVLAQKLAKFNLSNLAGKPDIPRTFLDFLQTSWMDHILKSDKEYSEFLNARGVH